MSHLKDTISRVLRRHSHAARQRGRILQKFAQKIGLIYFGAVDQHVDTHDIIRGLTVSTTHRDDHYAVGSYDGYDVSIVDRFDVIIDEHGNETERNWVILRISLEGPEDLAHFFLKPVNFAAQSYGKFFTAFSSLQPINSMLVGAHSQEFHGRYELYASSSNALEVETVLNTEATNIIAARLWPHAIEVVDGQLYVYTTETQLSEKLLETCLDVSLWLARLLDKSEI